MQQKSKNLIKIITSLVSPFVVGALFIFIALTRIPNIDESLGMYIIFGTVAVVIIAIVIIAFFYVPKWNKQGLR